MNRTDEPQSLKRVIVFLVSSITPTVIAGCFALLIFLTVQYLQSPALLIPTVAIAILALASILVGPFIAGEMMASFLHLDPRSVPRLIFPGTAVGIIALILAWNILPVDLAALLGD